VQSTSIYVFPCKVSSLSVSAKLDNSSVAYNIRTSKQAEHIMFPLVVSLLRLGRKYQFSDIWALARRTVQIQVPIDNVDSWNYFLDDNFHTTSDDDDIPGLWLRGHEFDLLNLAIEHGIQSILPVAYYLCAHYYPLVRVLIRKFSLKDLPC
jgi:hypothetical protein